MAAKQNVMDYVAEWEFEEEDELVIEKAELERWEWSCSKAGFQSTEHRNLVFRVHGVKQ